MVKHTIVSGAQGVKKPLYYGTRRRPNKAVRIEIAGEKPAGTDRSGLGVPAGASGWNRQQLPFHLEDIAWDLPDEPTAPEPADKKQRRRQTREEYLRRSDEGWNSARPELLYHSIAYAGGQEERNAALQEQLQSTFQQRVQAAFRQGCPNCGGADSVQLVRDGQPSVTYVCITAHTEVVVPTASCSACGKCTRVLPEELGCFRATPKQPTAWYDCELLALAHHLGLESPTSAGSFAEAMERLHQQNGCQRKPGIWANLGQALRQWRCVQDTMHSFEAPMYGVQPVIAGRWHRCPCCWRTCQAAVADACLAFRRFRKSASGSAGRAALYAVERFIETARLEELLAARRPAVKEQLDKAKCSNFKAAAAPRSKTEMFDRLGLCAVVCRHEFVLRAVELLTNENFVYYEALLADLIQEFGESQGRSLLVFFLDIACQFKPYWDRIVSAWVEQVPLGTPMPSIVVGPWHVLAHKLSCRLKYGARYAVNSGLSFGDAIEHLWSLLRPWAGLLKYMAPHLRQEILAELIARIEDKKEEKLALWLLKKYDEAADLHQQLAQEARKLLQDVAQLGVEHAEDSPATGNDLSLEVAQTVRSLEEVTLGRSGAAVEGLEHLALAGEVRQPPDSDGGRAPAQDGVDAAPADLAWQHKYQELLEEFYCLRGSEDRAPVPDQLSIAEQSRVERLSELGRQLAETERRHAVLARWLPTSQHYVQAAGERKLFHVTRLKAAVEDALAECQYHAVRNRHVDTDPSARQQDQQRQRKQLASLKQHLADRLADLRAWCSAPGEAVVLGVAFADLDLEGLLRAGHVPWAARPTEHRALLLRTREVQARAARCLEETAILQREADDMVEYYRHYAAELAACKERLAATPPAIPHAVLSDRCATAAGHQLCQAAWVAGLQRNVSCALARTERLLECALAVVHKLRQNVYVATPEDEAALAALAGLPSVQEEVREVQEESGSEFENSDDDE